jgi:hypothetical protein
MLLKNLIGVAPRYTRAIQLERDASIPGAIDGYVVTTTAERVLGRLAASESEPTGHRAWTLTGPYGSGKSAFSLYLSHLFGDPTSEGSRLARTILKTQQRDLHRQFFEREDRTGLEKRGFYPILISGASESLLGALLRACCRDLRACYPRGRRPDALKLLESAREAFERGDDVGSTAVVDAIVRLTRQLQSSRKARGVLLIIDELGKFLEFAARSPGQGDLHLLQQLAEATAQFNPSALWVITVLHQAFERYAADLRPTVREEWAKIQGRFEDIAFQEPPEQLLDLVASAIQHPKPQAVRTLKDHIRALAEQAVQLDLVPRGMFEAEFIELMGRCTPLHPLAVLVLVRLCRKFGQNQRSLFSFLVSGEPHGFASFLARDHDTNDPVYGLPELYDYVAEALGNGLSVGEGAARWAQVHAALEQTAGATSEEIRLVKIVGLLSAAGIASGLKPSVEIAEFAFGDPRGFKRALKDLQRKSVLIERRHNDTLALWEGSDIDLDERLTEAARHVIDGPALASKIAALAAVPPVVAKRHSFQTGTLRYFPIRFADVTTFAQSLDVPADADGLLLYCLPGSKHEREQLADWAQHEHLAQRGDLLVAVTAEATSLRRALRELEMLRWVQGNTPQLTGDATARRELRARLALVEDEVDREIQRLSSPTDGLSMDMLWFHRGAKREVQSTRGLAALLSDVCDEVYSQTPILRNELLNRRKLSSAAAAARRNLLEGMISRGSEVRLGLEGTPPEMSMYAAVLERTGIHRKQDGEYAFGSPTDPSNPKLGAVWQAIQDFFAESESRRQSVEALFERLQRPPFGLKMGALPVLFTAAVLARDTEVALYESGAFLPELTMDALERLIRSPAKFEVRHYQIAGVRREIFRQLAALFGQARSTDKDSLVTVMKPLFRFFNKLTSYTRQTKTLSSTALAVREALLLARDPSDLIFLELPQACGLEPFTTSAEAEKDRAAPLLKSLHEALGELQRSYEDLLADLRCILFEAFHLPEAGARPILAAKAGAIAEHCGESRLKAFAYLLSEELPQDNPWTEALATMVVGKAAKSWTDADRVRYQIGVKDLVRSFRHTEALVFEETKQRRVGRTPEQILRIGVSGRNHDDLEAVVSVDRKDRKKFEQAVCQLDASLKKLSLSSRPELALAALAAVSSQMLQTLHRKNASKPGEEAEHD